MTTVTTTTTTTTVDDTKTVKDKDAVDQTSLIVDDSGMERITNPVLRKLAFRGGVLRMSNKLHPLMRSVIKSLLYDIATHAVVYMEDSKRKTLIVDDITRACALRNLRVYGINSKPGSHIFGHPSKLGKHQSAHQESENK